MKKRRLILVIFIMLVIIVAIGLFALKKYQEEKNQEEINSAIHGVVIAEYTPFYTRPETTNVRQIRLLKKTENVYILDEFKSDDVHWYKVKVDGKTNGYVRAEDIDYYKEVKKEKVIVSDVSQFNIEKNFETQGDYEVFLLENKINYVYPASWAVTRTI